MLLPPLSPTVSPLLLTGFLSSFSRDWTSLASESGLLTHGGEVGSDRGDVGREGGDSVEVGSEEGDCVEVGEEDDSVEVGREVGAGVKVGRKEGDCVEL